MKIYELNLHLPTTINESDKEAIWNKAKDLLKKTKSEIVEEVAFRQLELAYPIKKESYTFFGSLYFKALPLTILELQELLDHEQKILRYMVVTHREVPKKYVPRKRPDRIEKPIKEKDSRPVSVKRKQEEKKIASSGLAPDTKEAKGLSRTRKKEDVVRELRKQPKKEVKIKLEDIDKSLEKLLEKEL